MTKKKDNEKQANELRYLLGKLPRLSVFIDEVHHAVTDEIKLRAVINNWIETNPTVNSVIGFQVHRILKKARKFQLPINLKLQTAKFQI